MYQRLCLVSTKHGEYYDATLLDVLRITVTASARSHHGKREIQIRMTLKLQSGDSSTTSEYN
ncbi:hypothetical protein CY34DRAFT_805195 [Suillus luteus UH-Slu-Lm8-n1]|uniref:Uncharacterized protein n=1 Tax=Suillus luteus UH-Slu-Lm8-n1 TaxID=930992 RepID=A0A0D0AWH9_9AGAM|nr:hypothetical protein CY34DRAFT_805195 [Suillus luteus UH-Slu-Lm8-n1]